MENGLLLLVAGMALFYANNLVAAFVCQQIEEPRTHVAMALCLIQLATVCTLLPLTRHLAYEKVLPAVAADWRWQLRNYLPGVAYFACALPVFWFQPEPWPRSAGYVFTGFNIPGILYFIPGCLRPYRVFRQQPQLFPERGWRQLIWTAWVIMLSLIMMTMLAPFVSSPHIRVAVSIGLKLIMAAPSLVMIHGMLRYGFLDIVLKRSLLYAIVGIELLGLYVALAFLARQTPLGDLTVALPALRVVGTLGLAAILAAAFKPLREQCERLLDRTVFRHSTRFRLRLLELAQELPRTADVAALVAAVADGLGQRLPVSGASVGITVQGQWFAAGTGAVPAPAPADGAVLRARLAGRGPADVTELRDADLCRRLRVQGVDLVVPVAAADGDGGVILLGHKPSGAVFLGEERAFLEAFAAQVAASLAHTRLLADYLAMGKDLARAEQLAAAGNLAARLAHEIRNPITAVKSLSQLVERNPTAPENAEHLRIVGEELERVERRVAGLLRLTRREEYHLERVDAAQLVRDVLDQFEGRLQESGVQLVVALPSVCVRADAEKLRQVLSNLIQNAIEAMYDAADRRLDVALAGDNGAATIRIADRGPGIPADDEHHIFEAFYTTKKDGTGLGLAIAKRIVDAHRGALSVMPNPDGGTIFTLQLPLLREPEQW